MLFNSWSFALFLPVVFFLYWVLANRKLTLQNIVLLLASYFFYACWDWRFLFLLIFSTLLDYTVAIQIFNSKSQRKKKIWFWMSLCINLGFLGFFKYYNFFIQSIAQGLAGIGIESSFWTLGVIIPVGISFYTFHGLSYIIDVYKGKIKPERNFVDYAVFVSFFPLLVAGPIERATHLLPQIQKNRSFSYDYAVDGLRQILWGLFKKIVIADNCAAYANAVFDHPAQFNGSTLVLGAVFFAIQIYGDFSGYSDIAIGTARLFGIDLLRNFAFPYFSRDIAEFWRRWHISLSSWFRDYVYIPLGGSKGSNWKRARNVFIIFILSGFWHGANWTFICWGLLNVSYILPLFLFRTNRTHLDIAAQGKFFPSVKELLSISGTFILTVFGWIFFRARNLTSAIAFFSRIFSRSLFSKPEGYTFLRYNAPSVLTIVILVAIFMIIEWSGRENKYAIEKIGYNFFPAFRWATYYLIIFSIVYFRGAPQQFIYFQF